MKWRLGLPACLAALAVGWSACGAEPIPAPQSDLTAARQFKRFSLYYLGLRYRGLPMTDDRHEALTPYTPGASVAFAYGQCVPEPSEEHDSCTPPVTVTNYPRCRANIAHPTQPRRTVRIRGARAGVFYDYGQFESVQFATGLTTVVVQGDGVRGSLAIVRELRSVDGRVSQRDRFPAPRPISRRVRPRVCQG